MAACGLEHSLLITEQGEILSGGSNEYGQLGSSVIPPMSSTRRCFMAMIPELTDVFAVACGMYHSVCLDTFGIVRTFGRNHKGQLGLGEGAKAVTPTVVPGLDNITAIACGYHFTLCLKDNDSLWGFGDNGKMQLTEINDTKVVFSPVIVVAGMDIDKIDAGAHFSVIITHSGSVYCAGCCRGFFRLRGFVNVFSKVTDIPEIREISCTSACLYMISDEGLIYELGHSCLSEEQTLFVRSGLCRINIDKRFISISCGYNHVIALDQDNTLLSFGWNHSGQLGCGWGSTDRITYPTIKKFVFPHCRYMYENLTDISCISSGGYHCFAQTSSGVHHWGNNSKGQLGSGTRKRSYHPQLTYLPKLKTNLMPHWSRVKSARK